MLIVGDVMILYSNSNSIVMILYTNSNTILLHLILNRCYWGPRSVLWEWSHCMVCSHLLPCTKTILYSFSSLMTTKYNLHSPSIVFVKSNARQYPPTYSSACSAVTFSAVLPITTPSSTEYNIYISILPSWKTGNSLFCFSITILGLRVRDESGFPNTRGSFGHVERSKVGDLGYQAYPIPMILFFTWNKLP
jgi:hypothetical protein